MTTVTTQAELEAALAEPRVVSLAGGVYSIPLTERHGVTFRAADPDDPPVIANLRITGCAGLAFEGLTFANQHPAPAVFDAPWQATGCVRLEFHGCMVRGVMQPAGRGHGLTFAGCGEVVLEDCHFEALRKGLLLRKCEAATIRGCSFRAMAEDAIALGECKGVWVDRCRMVDFWGDPADAPHPDAISLGKEGCADVTIERVLVADAATRPPAGLVQLRAQGVHAHRADGVMIKDSVFAVLSLNAVLIERGEGVSLDGVTVMALADDAVPRVTIPSE